jgi:hypothetical protein
VLRLEKNSTGAGDGVPCDGQAAASAVAVAAAPFGNADDLSVTPNGAYGRPSHPFRRRSADSEFDASGDHPPHSVHKIEFPKFNGTGDPMAWLNCYEWYFVLHGTPEH